MTQRVVCAPDKFRGSLTAVQAARAMADGARQAGWEAQELPVADGGEGSLSAVLAGGGTERRVQATDALGRSTTCPWGMLADRVAVVEAAAVVGLAGLDDDERDPLRASSAGLAAPLIAARDAGATEIVVFLGGTATMDGGLGLLTALGATARDADGADVAPTGAGTADVAALDIAPARQAMAGISLTVATDVTSPLLGEHGAARVFGPQKGATPEMVQTLEAGLANLARHLGEAAERTGAGAAGGLGAALAALGARQVPGATRILELVGLDAALGAADLCLTGEGKVDRSTLLGKAPAAVVERATTARVRCLVLAGTLTEEGRAGLIEQGAAGVLAIGRGPVQLAEAVRTAESDLTAAARAACLLATSL